MNRPVRRATDRDRSSTIDILRQAVASGQLSLQEFDDRSSRAWAAAATMDDLAGLIDDLQEPEPTSPSPAVPVAARKNTDVAFFGGTERAGHWLVGPRYFPIAVFGGIEIDLRYARFTGDSATSTCYAVFGGIDIIAPPGMTVVVRGHGVFGGFDVEGEPNSQTLSPTVYIEGLAFFGGVDVTFKP